MTSHFLNHKLDHFRHLAVATSSNKPEIPPSNCEPVDLKEIADSCEHLSDKQREQLHKLLVKCKQVFDGKLRAYTDKYIHLEVESGSAPTRATIRRKVEVCPSKKTTTRVTAKRRQN